MRKRLLFLVLAAMLAATGCAADPETDTDAQPTPGETELSLAIGDVPDSIEGNVLEIPVEIEGVEIVAPDGDTSGDSGHFHVFIDREPVAEGETVPMEAGVVHSAENPIKLWGLSAGEHEITVVIGDGTHTRIHPDLEDSVTVTVDGPTVDATAPATITAGEDLTVELASEGIEVTAADGDTSGDTGHYHVLVDPDTVPESGDTIPAAEEGSIYHTTESSVSISGLEAGTHTIYVFMGDGVHTVIDPLVADKVTVTVNEEEDEPDSP